MRTGQWIGQPAEPPRFDRKGPPPNRKPDLRDSIFTVEDIRIENHDGIFVITAWKQREKLTRGDGKTMGAAVEMTVSSVNFKPETWPENAFRPSIEVPEKTRVIARDAARGTEYEWVNGKVQVRAGN